MGTGEIEISPVPNSIWGVRCRKEVPTEGGRIPYDL